MEEMPSAAAVTLSLSNAVCDSSGIGSPVEVTRLKLVTETATLLSSPALVLPAESVSGWDGNGSDLKSDVKRETMGARERESGEKSDLSEMIPKNGSSWIASDPMIQETVEDVILSLGDDPCGTNSEDLLDFDVSPKISLPVAVEIEEIGKGQIVAKVISLEEPSIGHEPITVDILTVQSSQREEDSNGFNLKASMPILQLSREKNIGKGGGRSVFELDYAPLWGSVSICGKRSEMEDAIASVPRLLKIPIKMLIGDRVIDGMSQSLSHLTAHFFGVYDGHGGSQVAHYCRERIHLALVEELKIITDELIDGSLRETQQMVWEKAFTRCFLKVDDEIGGKVSRGITGGNADSSNDNFEPIAPETVGSTAVVALICSSHIVVANCGDSRAVLFRGKEAMALSTDHKPNREDEYARIEASGGKVIQWNGHRVFGVLAMSRSIGDRYLKPWIIPEPEVTIIPRAREDELLILASDGLWDVMTNEEACEVARRRILLWHRRNGDNPLVGRGEGVDPAAQAASDYLSVHALQKGSTDNISVIVVDLKAQRKFKSKS
ncbi:protein phosphatase 2C 16-like [Cornus florida]|uniref:protein phosphatase 2C 16-like n=1 Tax=Cornus florida TaxID=4283 RepID=UPI00289ED4A2|nr:protein phosphatase 2C 16-like [Cornus florida]XP_059641795.1 protein phosphatase 2C 16-like [Cornus florida]XP_059641796.1 protein phosphatase 2C 16-like [Cornus florida]